MRCLRCGHLLASNDIYCSHCGSMVKESRDDKLISYYTAQICFVYDRFEKVSTPRNETLTFIKAHSKYGWSLLDLNCTKVIDEHYSDIVPHIEDDGEIYYFVKRGDKWALRTRDRYITEYTYDYMDWSFWGGYIPGYCEIMVDGKKGVMKIKTGEIIFDCIFDKISSSSSCCSDHVRAAQINGKYGIINIERGSYLTSFDYIHEGDAFEAFRKIQLKNLSPFAKQILQVQNVSKSETRGYSRMPSTKDKTPSELIKEMEEIRKRLNVLLNKK